MPGGVGVDLELDQGVEAGGREPPREDSEARTSVSKALPGREEIAVGIHFQRGPQLRARGEDVDLELDGQRRARAREAATEDAVDRAILRAFPYHDEITVSLRADLRVELTSGAVCVDLELGAERGAAA